MPEIVEPDRCVGGLQFAPRPADTSTTVDAAPDRQRRVQCEDETHGDALLREPRLREARPGND